MITKGNVSENMPVKDSYGVIAKKEINKFPFLTHGISYIVINKQSQAIELSDKLYYTVIKSVEKLAENIEKYTGTRPEFLKNLEK